MQASLTRDHPTSARGAARRFLTAVQRLTRAMASASGNAQKWLDELGRKRAGTSDRAHEHCARTNWLM